MKNDPRALAQAQAIKEGIVNLRTIIAEASCVPSSFLPTLNNKFQEIAKKCYIPENISILTHEAQVYADQYLTDLLGNYYSYLQD